MFFIRFLSGTLVLLTVVFILAVAQVGDPNIEWYRSFFLEKKRTSIEKALSDADARLQHAAKTDDAGSMASALTETGLIHLTYTHDYGKAMDFLIEAMSVEDSLQLQEQQIFTCLAIAKVFEEVGDYPNSAEFLQQALTINETFNNSEVLALIQNELGKVNASSRKVDAAFANYQNVLNLKDQIKDRHYEAEAQFNLGHLYQQQGKFDSALRHQKVALSIRRSMGDSKNEARTLNDIGELYQAMGNSEKALANHVVALEIRQVLRDKRAMAESFNNIGALYFQQKNYQRAVSNLVLALDNAQESDDKHQIRKSYEYLSECYEAVGDYKKALEYKDLYVAISELAQAEQNEQQMLTTQNKYEITKRQTLIENLEIDRQNQKRFQNILFVVIALILVIVVLVLYLYVSQQRSNRRLKVAHDQLNVQNLELQELNATKDKFFSIISHDLKGPLNSLTSFSSLLINHTDSLSKEEIKMFASDFDKSLKNLFSLLENLLEWSRSQTGNIEFVPESFDLAAMLEENKELLKAQAQNKRITLVNESQEKVLINAHKNSINTVVRNLISNAIKFTPEGGTITLKSSRQNGSVVTSIADTGVGMSQNVIDKLFRLDSKHSTKGTANEKGTGLGLILCKEFVEKNGGKIWVNSKEGEGTVFYFSLQ